MAVDDEQAVGVASAVRVSKIAVGAAQGPVGGAGDHGAAIHHHELVVHQAAALAAVSGVVDQGNVGLGQNGEGIAIAQFLLPQGPILVGIDKGVQVVGLGLVVLIELGDRPWVPLGHGGAVGVLDHHAHLDPSCPALRQGMGNAR